ncbi:MAG: acyl-CoA dehydrogenase, partial [Alcaligenaceae bacterium]
MTTSQLINRRDLDFLLYEVMDAQSLFTRDRYVDHSRETFDAAIDTAIKIAETRYAIIVKKGGLQQLG